MDNNTDHVNESILRRTRESKGITLEMVHEATKIPMDSLRAIEEGYSVRMLSPFYYRGFIKIYAQFLDLDADQVLREYKMEKETAKHPYELEKPDRTSPYLPQKSSAKQTLKAPEKNPVKPVEPAPASPSAPSLPIGSILRDIGRFFTPRRLRLLLQIAAVVFGLFVVFKLFAFIGDKWNSRSQKPRAAQTRAVAKPAAPKPLPPQKEKAVATALETYTVTKQDPPPPPATTAVAPAGRTVSLTVRAKKDSWLQVKADGEVVFQTTLKRGVAESWTAQENIELSGKNINQLEFEVNGKVLGSLGPSDRRAKKVVITKDGLSVKK